MNETIPVYRMNPAEDEIVFGDALEEGQWVLCEDALLRSPHGYDEDLQMRRQRFRRVRQLRHEMGTHGPVIVFVGEWVDGYQEVHRYAESFGWLVKKAAASDEPGGAGPC